MDSQSLGSLWFKHHLCPFLLLDKRTSGDTEGAGIRGDSLGAMSHIKLRQGASNGGILNRINLVPPVSLLVLWFEQMFLDFFLAKQIHNKKK